MSQRIERAFKMLAKNRRKALIPFIMGGDPTLKASAKLLAELPAAGADLIEIGFPFSDPMADGPIIQAAGLRALKAKTTLKDVLSLVKGFRKNNDITPIILMGYYNPLYCYGVEKFCKDAAGAGVDGVIIVDLPPEEEMEFVSLAKPYGLRLIRLIAPTTDDARLRSLSRNAGGFLYYIAVAGVTGTKSADTAKLKTRVKHLKSRTKLPVAVGFGIKTPEQAREVAAFSDAVVVGSALVAKGPAKGVAFVKALRKAIG